MVLVIVLTVYSFSLFLVLEGKYATKKECTTAERKNQKNDCIFLCFVVVMLLVNKKNS